MTDTTPERKVIAEIERDAVAGNIVVDQSKRADDNFIRFVNRNFTQVVVISFAYIVFIVGFLFLYVYVGYAMDKGPPKADPPLEFVALAMGSLGAFFNMLLRYYNSATEPDHTPADQTGAGLKTHHIIGMLSLPTIIGAISGLIVYIIFAAGLIKGSLFPEFACKSGDCKTFISVVQYWAPVDKESYIKAFLWSFIAGFSQRTMFGYLDRFINSK